MTMQAAKHPPLDGSGVVLRLEKFGNYYAIRNAAPLGKLGAGSVFLNTLYNRGLIERANVSGTRESVLVISHLRVDKFRAVMAKAGVEFVESD